MKSQGVFCSNRYQKKKHRQKTQCAACTTLLEQHSTRTSTRMKYTRSEWIHIRREKITSQDDSAQEQKQIYDRCYKISYNLSAGPQHRYCRTQLTCHYSSSSLVTWSLSSSSRARRRRARAADAPGSNGPPPLLRLRSVSRRLRRTPKYERC